MQRIRPRALCLSAILALTTTGFAPTPSSTSTPLVVETDGIRVTSTYSAERGACLTSIRATARITSGVLFEQVRVTFDENCRPTVTRDSQKRAATTGGGRLAAPLAAHGYRVQCRSLNQLWGPGGSGGGNLRTEYRTWLEFEVAEGAVWSVYATGSGAYVSPFTFYRWTNEYQYEQSLGVPALSIRNRLEGRFYYGPAWDHDKENDAYGYGNGQCSTSFIHDGYVWDGVVEFRLEYY